MTAADQPTPSAWAVLDANGKVIAVRLERETAEVYAEFTDGSHIKPLVLADLDSVATPDVTA